MNLRVLGLALAISSSIVPTRLLAGDYWVLGSFTSSSRAAAEQGRLADALGVPVATVDVEKDGRQYTRIVVSYPGTDEARAALQADLISVGIEQPWRISVDTPIQESQSVQSAMAASDVFLVVASFSDVEQSIELERRLDRAFSGVTTQTRLVGADLYYRVMLGPVPKERINAMRGSLSGLGFGDAWSLPASEVDGFPDGTVARLRSSTLPAAERKVARDVPARQVIRTQSVKQVEPGGGTGGFNLATLDTRAGARAFFADEEDDARWTTDVAFEYRGFPHEASSGAARHHPSISLEAEYFNTWNDGNDLFAFVPFYRYDREDGNRTHFDIRELTWVHVGNSWEFRAGIRKVFWGVTESQHLVDIINQTDNLENPDGEDKLGQPMLNLSLIRDWGMLDVYVLPGFREREYAGVGGRPRLPILVDTDAALFESSAEKRRTDAAIRWSNYFGDLEVGLSHFSGTSREPRFQVAVVTDALGVPVSATLVPVYDVIDQTGLDAQYFIGDWAWKLEAITRSGQGDRFSASTFGFEKTFVGVLGRADLGVVAEYLHDSRGGAAPVVGDNDLALGFRLTRNDAADSTVLLVFVQDQDSHELFTTLEGSMRIGSNWKLVVEGTVFSNAKRPGPGIVGALTALADTDSDLGFLSDEDFFKIELVRYF